VFKVINTLDSCSSVIPLQRYNRESWSLVGFLAD